MISSSRKHPLVSAAIFLSLPLLFWIGCSSWHYTVSEKSDIAFYQPPQTTHLLDNPDPGRPRNIILCIGDGMGTNQIALARQAAAGAAGRLWMERMPYTALVSTHNVRGEVTDSAAAITAILCGIKTRNDRLGQDEKGVNWISLPQRLQSDGCRLGVVVTSAITHATPAGMAAHVPNRDMEARIAEQMFDARIDVLLGGGRKYWLPESEPEGLRADRRNLLAEAQRAGYTLVRNQQQLQAVEQGRVLGLFQAEALTTLPPEPSLQEMTQAALRILTNSKPEKPFFLLIEGSQIDWACHANQEEVCIRQTLLFDLAVREALNYAAADKQTLVLVTADHETGELTLSGGSLKPNLMKAHWSSKNHSAAQVALFAFGPGAEQFTGVLDNTEISRRIAHLLGIEDFPKTLPKKRAAAQSTSIQMVSILSK